MKSTITAFLLCVVAASAASAQIRVNPLGVNVNAQGATTVFLTFGRLQGYVAAESFWCGALIASPGDVGQKCDPSTIYGLLPARYDVAQRSGTDGYTDIMSLPPSVARRAYEAAAAGKGVEFFYVRRFVNPAGGQDQYVAVTCRLTGGGAGVPLSLTDVTLAFDVDTPVLQVKTGEAPPRSSAKISYTGTGRLKGRWEVVLPGQDPPSGTDLLTEATMPVEQRGTQHRYLEVGRFNVFLAPTGRFTLPGPDASRLPTNANGQYFLLLRIEASDDKEADSDLADVGAGGTVVHAGGVAGFPMPVLRYVVGDGGSELTPATVAGDADGLFPPDGTAIRPDAPMDLRWRPMPQTAFYRVEIESVGRVVHQAFVSPSETTYRLPPFVSRLVSGADLRWRIVSVNAAGRDTVRTEWRRVTNAR